MLMSQSVEIADGGVKVIKIRLAFPMLDVINENLPTRNF